MLAPDFVRKRALLPYPDRVAQPALLGRMAADLSDEDLTRLPAVRAEYQQALARYETERQQHDAAWQEMLTRFCAALIGAYAPWANEEVGNVLYGAAWERGHSSGLQEVELEFTGLASLASSLIQAHTGEAPKRTPGKDENAAAPAAEHAT